MSTYKIIVNPISGRGAGEKSIPEIHRLLANEDIEYDLIKTERPGHAIELTQNACIQGYKVVVAVGGDGTANEVLNGLMRSKQEHGKACAMGVVGVGRGNDFAFGANVAIGLEEGCHSLLEGFRRPIDVGKVTGGDYPGGRYFGNGVGIGFDAVVGFVAAKMKRLSGFPSYLVSALKTIFLYYHAPLVRMDFDGQQLQLSSLMISIMNGRRMGGGFLMAPNAHPDDGLLDLCVAEEVSKARIFALIPKFMQGTQATQSGIHTAQARKVTVTALQGSLPVHADGETICTEGKEITVELMARQIEIICKPPEGKS